MLKRSYYNLIFEREGKQYIYNTLNNILGELDSAECISALKGTMDINELEKEKIAEFKAAGVIIDEECDEFEIIRERGNRGRYSSEKLSLTIIPSLICNYECIYCYQTANEK
ncbi:MAG: hypothetical protein IJT81_06435, partial [Lachnospiraceae bacterium]|nr:hypothetical protein [Lachnospiraceae bacterium]